jgi:hypothetical protein
LPGAAGGDALGYGNNIGGAALSQVQPKSQHEI